MSLTEQYGEFTITYDEIREKFVATLNGTEIHSSAKLADLRKALDRHGEAEKKFTRVKVFQPQSRFEGEGQWAFGEVTSISDDGRPWITDAKTKKRSKPWSSQSVYLDTPENAAIRAKIDELDQNIKALEENRRLLCESMTQFRK